MRQYFWPHTFLYIKKWKAAGHLPHNVKTFLFGLYCYEFYMDRKLKY